MFRAVCVRAAHATPPLILLYPFAHPTFLPPPLPTLPPLPCPPPPLCLVANQVGNNAALEKAVQVVEATRSHQLGVLVLDYVNEEKDGSTRDEFR